MIKTDDKETDEYFTCNYCESDFRNEYSHYFDDPECGYQRLVCWDCRNELENKNEGEL